MVSLFTSKSDFFYLFRLPSYPCCSPCHPSEFFICHLLHKANQNKTIPEGYPLSFQRLNMLFRYCRFCEKSLRSSLMISSSLTTIVVLDSFGITLLNFYLILSIFGVRLSMHVWDFIFTSCLLLLHSFILTGFVGSILFYLSFSLPATALSYYHFLELSVFPSLVMIILCFSQRKNLTLCLQKIRFLNQCTLQKR